MIYPFYSPAKDVYKPWIEVRLGYKKSHKLIPSNVVGLIDSGADVCFCSENIAFWLGSRRKGKNIMDFTTANDTTFKAYRDIFTLYACNKVYECPFYVADNLPRETPIILGLKGFFNTFKIKFDYPNEIIIDTSTI